MVQGMKNIENLMVELKLSPPTSPTPMSGPTLVPPPSSLPSLPEVEKKEVEVNKKEEERAREEKEEEVRGTHGTYRFGCHGTPWPPTPILIYKRF